MAVLHVPADAVVVLAGMPGAGKTTLLRRLEPDLAARVLDSEDVRLRLPPRWQQGRAYAAARPLVHLRHWRAMRRAIAQDGPLLLAETATRGPARALLAAWAWRAGRPLHLLLLDVDRATAEAGQRARRRAVRRGSMSRHERRWRRLVAALRGGRAPWGVSGAALINRHAAGLLDGVAFDLAPAGAVRAAAAPARRVRLRAVPPRPTPAR